MANAYGFQIKNLTSFRGHEGESLFQGDVWYRGKKMGFWSQDGWGGPDTFSFDTSAFDEQIKDMGGEFLLEDWTRINPDLSALLHELACLTLREKDFKRFAKQGCNYMFECIGFTRGVLYGFALPFDVSQKAINMKIRECQKLAAKDLGFTDPQQMEVKVYNHDSFQYCDCGIGVDYRVVKRLALQNKEQEKRMKTAISR